MFSPSTFLGSRFLFFFETRCSCGLGFVQNFHLKTQDILIGCFQAVLKDMCLLLAWASVQKSEVIIF